MFLHNKSTLIGWNGEGTKKLRATESTAQRLIIPSSTSKSIGGGGSCSSALFMPPVAMASSSAFRSSLLPGTTSNLMVLPDCSKSCTASGNEQDSKERLLIDRMRSPACKAPHLQNEDQQKIQVRTEVNYTAHTELERVWFILHYIVGIFSYLGNNWMRNWRLAQVIQGNTTEKKYEWITGIGIVWELSSNVQSAYLMMHLCSRWLATISRTPTRCLSCNKRAVPGPTCLLFHHLWHAKWK